jgi:membrane fusion protein, adhesin transport system
MLDITDNKLHCPEDMRGLSATRRNSISPLHVSFRRLMLLLLAIILVFMFLPWTQNVRGNGKLTTLRPEQRPQTIPSTIAGRIERWYITEGQQVKQGDTIVFLAEVKSEYFDPALVDRTGKQVEAKEGSILSYSGKADALSDQISAMRRELINKLGQLENKITQKELKVVSDSIEIQQAENDLAIAQRQFERIKTLFEKGLEPLTKYEERRLKLVDAETKIVKARNELDISRNELNTARIELSLTRNEFANKIAKADSDRFSTLSDRYDAEASVQKLRIDRESYARRAAFYYITAPQDGYVVKAVESGIGEFIKEGDPVVTILPQSAEMAVEMYVKPIDIPLMHIGSPVRFMFDGWPAFVFSGWPGLTLGTYAGHVVAIDRNISANGKFRILVAPDKSDAPWPDALRIGGGAQGIALLNDVPVWYEIWRMLNGFPPDMYDVEDPQKEKEDTKIIKIPKAK